MVHGHRNTVEGFQCGIAGIAVLLKLRWFDNCMTASATQWGYMQEQAFEQGLHII
jgi:hypothetical protein